MVQDVLKVGSSVLTPFKALLFQFLLTDIPNLFQLEQSMLHSSGQSWSTYRSSPSLMIAVLGHQPFKYHLFIHFTPKHHPF